MSVFTAQIPTHELISIIAKENVALAAHSSVSARNLAEVVTARTKRQVVDNVKNVRAFLGPIERPEFPSQWD